MVKFCSLILVSLLSIFLLSFWLLSSKTPEIYLREPIPENYPKIVDDQSDPDANQGTLICGSGLPSMEPGSWPQFRGANRDAVTEGFSIASSWSESGPKILWEIPVGEGHAGAAVHEGRVFLIDYDKALQEDVIRCLSLKDAEEIWRYTYFVKVKRNHGMSRTVPAVDDEFIVTLGPKCHVHCLKAVSGELVWKKSLVTEYGTKIPEWYAGQCPLIEKDRVILAPGGTCLMTAIELSTGKTIWETPNEDGWHMTHSSILPIEFMGERQYVWCSSGGAVGVSAKTGKILWKLPKWKIKIANIPSPIDLGNGKIFFSGGYNAGAVMCRLTQSDETIIPEIIFQIDAKTFGTDQQTPIFYKGYIYGVIPGGKLACLSQEGERLWVEEAYNFGLGPYSIIDNKLLVLDDDQSKPGELCLFEMDGKGVKKIASSKVLEGHDAWAPMAFVNGKVILRDLTTMICLDLTEGTNDEAN